MVNKEELQMILWDLFEGNISEEDENTRCVDQHDFLKIVESAKDKILPLINKSEWVSVDGAPIPTDRPIERFHHIYKCVVTVKINPFENVETCRWVDATLSNTWPEESFSPYWRECSQPPPQLPTTKEIDDFLESIKSTGSDNE